MAGEREIKNRIKSIAETRKITSAMYMISSTRLSRAKEILDTVSCDTSIKESISECIEFFGDVSILERAGQKAFGDRAKKAVKRLEEVYSLIKDFGIADNVTFDLGMLSKYNYYTGIIFRAYVPSAGDAVIKGAFFLKIE